MVIYFNNAATSWPKPKSVVDAVTHYFDNPPINSSRHCNCIKKNDDIDVVCKRKINEFFGVDDGLYSTTITCGSTYSVNTVVNYFKHCGKYTNLITSNEAHNSIYRTHFEKIGTKPTLINSFNELDKFAELLKNTKIDVLEHTYIAVTHENNVSGEVVDVNGVLDILKDKCLEFIPVIVDVTQSAGTYSVDVKTWDYKNLYVVCSGHKGLYSTTGIGFLISPKDKINVPFVSGGTGGVKGIDYEHTGSLEAGTPNEMAMASLVAGIEHIQKIGIVQIMDKKQNLVKYFLEKYRVFSKTSSFTEYFELVPVVFEKSGLVSFKILKKQECDEIITKLTRDYKIIVRSGVHCAPLYHINTLKCEGTMRISFGFYNKLSEIDYLFESLSKVV